MDSSEKTTVQKAKSIDLLADENSQLKKQLESLKKGIVEKDEMPPVMCSRVRSQLGAYSKTQDPMALVDAYTIALQNCPLELRKTYEKKVWKMVKFEAEDSTYKEEIEKLELKYGNVSEVVNRTIKNLKKVRADLRVKANKIKTELWGLFKVALPKPALEDPTIYEEERLERGKLIHAYPQKHHGVSDLRRRSGRELDFNIARYGGGLP